MLKQEDFDRFVESYNTDFFYLLTRASSGSYDCLITSFTVLKDLFDVINALHDKSNLEFKVPIQAIEFRGQDALLASFGFDHQQVQLIYGFLDHVKYTQGKEFEQCITEGIPLRCASSASR